MYKAFIHLLPVIFFIILFSFLYPSSASADYQEIYKGITFTVTMSPSEITAQQSTSATITVTSDKPFFVATNQYGFYTEPHDNKSRIGDAICSLTSLYGAVKSETTLVVDLTRILSNQDSCLHKDSQNWIIWKTEFWSGNPKRGENVYLKNFTFTVLPPGGATPQIYAANSPVYYEDDPIVHITNLKKGHDYTLWWDGDHTPAASNGGSNDSTWTADNDGDVDKILNNPQRKVVGKKTLKLAYGWHRTIVSVQSIAEVEFEFTDVPNSSKTLTCTIKPNNKVEKNQPVEIEIKNPKPNTDYTAKVFDSNNISLAPFTVNSKTNPTIYITLGKLSPDTYKAQAAETAAPDNPVCTGLSIEVGTPSEKIGGGCKIGEKDCAGSAGTPIKGCNEPINPKDPNDPAFTNPGIPTAIGCIHTNPSVLVKDILTFLLGIGGGLAFLMMLLGAFQILTSAGNPETLSAGKDRLTSAIIGLLFIIFTILLLQIIGVSILNIPGFK
ncbi:pilin [Patescibacteria group bacterium]|nr:pilin [Patescibacteria group bacterium]